MNKLADNVKLVLELNKKWVSFDIPVKPTIKDGV